MVLKDIRVDEDLKRTFQCALFNAREGKKIEKTNSQDAVGEYMLSMNHFMSCVTKLKDSSLSYPSIEQDVLSMMEYMCKKANKMGFSSKYSQYVEQSFKLSNICPVSFSESTQTILTNINQGHLAEIEIYENMIEKTSACKKDRFEAELEGKILKWEIQIRKKEFKFQLKKQMEQHFEKSSMYYLFSGDYRYRLSILESLKENLSSIHLTLDNLDMILKWCTLMLMKNNPLIIYKVLDYLIELFSLLKQDKYILNGSELYYFLPYLLRKLCDPRPTVPRAISAIFKLIASTNNASRCSDIIMDLMNKNNLDDFNIACIELLSYLIRNFGLDNLDHRRLVTNLKKFFQDKKLDDAGKKALEALAIAKLRHLDILKIYLNENEIEFIPEPDTNVLDNNKKISLKNEIEKFDPYIFNNTVHLKSSIENIFHQDIDIEILNLLNIEFFLVNGRKCDYIHSLVNLIVYFLTKRIQLLVTEIFDSASMIQFEFFDLLIDTLDLIFDFKLGLHCEKSYFKFMLYTFLDLTSIQNYEKTDGLLINKLYLTVNCLFSKYDANLAFESLFELLSDVVNNTRMDKNLEFQAKFLDELIKFMDIRTYLFVKHLPPGHRIKDLMNIGEFLVFMDLFFAVNPINTWNQNTKKKYFYKILQFLIEIIKQTFDIMKIFESIKIRLKENSLIEYIVITTVKEKEIKNKKK